MENRARRQFLNSLFSFLIPIPIEAAGIYIILAHLVIFFRYILIIRIVARGADQATRLQRKYALEGRNVSAKGKCRFLHSYMALT